MRRPKIRNKGEFLLHFRFFFATIAFGRGNGKRLAAPLPFGLSRAAGRLKPSVWLQSPREFLPSREKASNSADTSPQSQSRPPKATPKLVAWVCSSTAASSRPQL